MVTFIFYNGLYEYVLSFSLDNKYVSFVARVALSAKIQNKKNARYPGWGTGIAGVDYGVNYSVDFYNKRFTFLPSPIP
jgi:hypothetical protein